MKKNSTDRFLYDLLKNATIIHPRERSLYQVREGIFHKCLERYIQMQLKEHRNSEGFIRVYCSYVTEEEERFFSNVLFDLLFDSDYVYEAELYVVLNELSELIDLDSKSITKILDGLLMLKIEMRISPYEEINVVQGSSIFPTGKTGRCFNFKTGKHDSEMHFFKLSINPDFLKACSEVKQEMRQ